MPERVDVMPTRRSRRACLQAMLGLGAGAWFGMPATAAASPLVQVFGRPAQHPQRLFAAGPPAAVAITCLAPERLLGWPMSLSDAAKAQLPAVVRDKPLLGRLAGRGSTVSLEALLALKPDLIVDAGSVDANYVSTAQRVAAQTGIGYALVDGRLADTAAQLRELGALLGVPARAQALAAYADEVLGEAALVTGSGGGRPTVYLARGADGLETATAGAINAEIIEASGGRNVAATGRAGVARVSMEQVLAWAPQWVLTQDRNFFHMARADTLWRTLPAIREGSLLLAPDQPFGWLDGPPSLNRLAGVKWLAAHLRRGQPAVREALKDTLDDALRFYALFYGATPARETVQAWLQGRG